MIHTIRVQTKGKDLKGEGVLHELHLHKIHTVTKIQTVRVYRVEGATRKEAEILAKTAFSESINQTYSINTPLLKGTKHIFEIAYKPGVMNPEVSSILKTARDLGIHLVAADASFEYAFFGRFSDTSLMNMIKKATLFNPTIEEILTRTPTTLRIKGAVGKSSTVGIRDLSASSLLALSTSKQLFLDTHEMQIIQSYFQKLHRDPTECELEILAQTWSEHCVHKTFKAHLTIDGKKKTPLFHRIKGTAKGYEDRIVSAFVDNSGVIDFYDGYGICGKVETHNSPSAIEPYGGAMTGSGGVFRDILGTGQGARILCASDIFCFAPPELPENTLPEGVLPPKYLLKKVVAGVRDYGNRVGIPTNNGSIHFHKDFRAKPTVAVGAYGVIEKKKAAKRSPQIGDLIVTIGGRTGRDGIHGATFSSGEMTGSTKHSAGSAVQIGNAIEEKRMIDAVLEMSRRGLLRALTDCGAGGYSSAIGEMAETTGATVHLDKVPLKYATLSPWEIYLSESQERMVLAIDPKHKKEIQKISNTYNVEATEIGIFDGTKRLNILYNSHIVADLSMDFLHNGLPTRQMTGVSQKKQLDEKYPSLPKDYKNLWLKVLSHGNVCSKEPIVRLYDHNVMGATALHPFSGITQDGPNDGSVVKPFLDKPYGLITTHGLNPALNAIDPYWGSIWAITEAVSNYVAVGGDLRDAALIDNFIWPYPDEASLADLDTSVDACVALSKLLRLPFVSGKDSLSSTYRFGDGKTLKIPPVLLISVFGKIKDVAKTLSSDFKKSDSLIVLVGKPDSRNLGGTTYFELTHCTSASVPKVDLATLPKTLTAITKGAREGTILSAHDISEGGIASALAEMCFGAGFGARINLKTIDSTRPDFLFFNETAGTFLVEVADKNAATTLFRNIPHVILGSTRPTPTLQVFFGTKLLTEASLHTLKKAWQEPMNTIFN
ncbi:MAG: hypothetical protein RLZZ455_807 [Candidatus Parcubacteria bacterium]|jgi:phosphoribosylformylglycinamidine synthase